MENILNLLETGPQACHSFALDILNGLSDTPKTISSQYLYDAKGSWLYKEITDLEEYYPTGCEFDILNRHKENIWQMTQNKPFRLLELGVGDARKTKVLLDYFVKKGVEFEYVLIDCCQEIVEYAVSSLKKLFQNTSLRIIGVVAEHSAALVWASQNNSLRNIVLFLGSSIGNFDHKQTEHFLHEVWNALNDGDCVYMGFDLKKDIHILQKAYDDTAGVTREFNLNLLERINRELEADFDRDQFMHHCFYNPHYGRMESWILSKIAQSVTIGKLQKSFDFEAWEGIHVENSYKYVLQGF